MLRYDHKSAKLISILRHKNYTKFAFRCQEQLDAQQSAKIATPRVYLY
jgi:hypothetical protein